MAKASKKNIKDIVDIAAELLSEKDKVIFKANEKEIRAKMGQEMPEETPSHADKPLTENLPSPTGENAKVVNGVLILEKEKDDLETLSPTKIKAVNDCEARFKYRYIDGLKIPPASSLVLGSSFDDATSTNYTQKIKTDKDLPVEDVVDAFVTSYNIRKDDCDFNIDETPEEIKDLGVKLIREYQREFAPNINPAEIQKKYEIKFKGAEQWKFIGIADILEKDGTIRDTKTSKKSPSRIDGEYIISDDYRFQTLCYSIGEKSLKGREAGNNIFVDYAVKLKNPKVISVRAPIPTMADMKYFQQMTARTFKKIQLIKEGLLPVVPNRGSFLCSKKYCGFWSRCILDYGGSVKD